MIPPDGPPPLDPEDGRPNALPPGEASEDETLSMGRLRSEGPAAAPAGEEPLSHRHEIDIPDYTLLKRIGSGAYGEVWLAQSVTGALRAVKIVWREDFELTRTFHREFEGIQQFEPISRGHPCLVHILHVGWNEERGFYYCVMELADDAEKGAQIDDLATYSPRTVSSDLKTNGRLDLHFCREAGIYLADALHYMHRHGLAHRDIKPSNIIFVGGVCKLADIGLVAAAGERSFVGTEGFVPPEGPGSPQADLYSLGKVLYEMSSGNDRMEFPEVPANLSDAEWPLWMDLNRVICKACAPDLQERFPTAQAFAEGLQGVGTKRPEAGSVRATRATVVTVVGSALTAAALVMAKQQEEWTYEVEAPGLGQVVERGDEPRTPQVGRPWRSADGRWFSFQADRHVSDRPLEFELYNRFLDDTLRPFEGEVVSASVPGQDKLNVVLIQPEDAQAYCDWATGRAREGGYLTASEEFAWKPARLSQGDQAAVARKGLKPVRCQVVRVPTGRLTIHSHPAEAEVFDGETLLGVTPLELDGYRAGRFRLRLVLPGFVDQRLDGTVEEGEATELAIRLRASGAVVFDQEWTNSLGMKLVPLGRALLGATEVRRRDYQAFVSATRRKAVPARDLAEQPDFPVTHVSREDAEAFCVWLTQREQSKGLLGEEQGYRLLTDDEWSMAAYLPRERGDTPAERNLRIEGIYPWGFVWPPQEPIGNFADGSRSEKPQERIPRYEDQKPGLAKVGSFEADSRGLSDLSGNVWEWVSDPWSGDARIGVVRGGAFTTHKRQELLASYRRRLAADSRLPDVGFRILLTPDGRSAREGDPEEDGETAPEG